MLMMYRRSESMHVMLAKETVAQAYEEARQVDYAPYSPQMAALARAESTLAEVQHREPV